ncbi:hypothetical protein CLOM_g16007 [Closterium sp. NIES-68]|nr:hypothetical protein CLOM_g16007 [Closterium sp. NIES-68]
MDKAFYEFAELDRTPGHDGRQVINAAELYACVLLAYNYVNKFSPGSHLDPPKKTEVFRMMQKFDLNSDGFLDREEFEKFLENFSKNLTRRAVVNAAVVCAAVPTLVFLTKASLKEFEQTHKIGKKIPSSLLACVFTTVFRIAGLC